MVIINIKDLKAMGYEIAYRFMFQKSLMLYLPETEQYYLVEYAKDLCYNFRKANANTDRRY